MTDSKQLPLAARALRSDEIAQALGLAPNDWGVMLWTLVERTNAGFGIKDSHTGLYVYGNARLAVITGRSVAGISDGDWVSGEAMAALRAADQ